IGLSGLFAPAYAQWLHADPGTPRTRDGKPILTAPAPRLNGNPDLSGVWEGCAAHPGLPEILQRGKRLRSAQLADRSVRRWRHPPERIFRNEARRGASEA